MSLAERLAAARPEPKPRGFKAWVAGLDDEDRAALEAHARDTAWSTRELLVHLRTVENVAVSRETLAVWRRGCGFSG